MDTPTSPPPVAPGYPPQTPVRPDRKRLVLLGLGALALIALGYGIYSFDSFTHGPPPVAVVSDELPLRAMQSVSLSDGTLTPVAIEGQGTAVLIDMATTENATYYLMSDPAFTRVNLYRKTTDLAGLAEVTHSATAKYDLSFDAQSNSAAYMSVAADGTPEIMVWQNAKDTEESLGAGTHPTILPGGFFVIAEREGKLISIDIATKEVHELLTLSVGAEVAVDAANFKAAVYDPDTSMVHEYSLAGLIAVSYLGSTPVTAMPRELAYIDGELIALLVENGMVRIGAPNRLTEYSNMPPDFANGRKLTTYHD